MKKLLLYSNLIILIIVNACSDNSTGTITGPGGIGDTGGGGAGTGGGGISFTIGNQRIQEGLDFDQDGQADESFYLTAIPSVSIKITQVIIEIPGNINFDSVQGDGTTVYNANQEVQVNTTPYYNVSSGQKFTLKFTGKLAAGDQAFSITSDYTVP